MIFWRITSLIRFNLVPPVSFTGVKARPIVGAQLCDPNFCRRMDKLRVAVSGQTRHMPSLLKLFSRKILANFLNNIVARNFCIWPHQF